MSRRGGISSEAGFVKALAAIAQTSRLRVFRLLIGAGTQGLCPGEIAGALGLQPNALSFHLKALLAGGLITQQREGRFLRYRADLEVMQQLLSFLTAHCCQGKPCLELPGLECVSPFLMHDARHEPNGDVAFKRGDAPTNHPFSRRLRRR